MSKDFGFLIALNCGNCVSISRQENFSYCNMRDMTDNFGERTISNGGSGLSVE